MHQSHIDTELREVEKRLFDLCHHAIQTTLLNQKKEIAQELEKQTQSLQAQTNSPIIKLSVGGRQFTTTLATLTSVPDSKLAKMFQGIIPIVKDEKGVHFIDRNGEYFSYILDFLRDKTLFLPSDSFTSKKVKEEMQYFQLVPEAPLNVTWTWDPSKQFGVSISNDNMTVTKIGGAGCGVTVGTEMLESGVYRWQVKITHCVNSYWVSAGIYSENEIPNMASFNYGMTWGMSSDGAVYRMTGTGANIKLAQGDVCEFEYDTDSGEFTMEVSTKQVKLTATVKGQKLRPYAYVWTVGDCLTLSFD